MVNVKSSMLIFVAFAVMSEVTVALLPPFAYTAAQAIMGKSWILFHFPVNKEIIALYATFHFWFFNTEHDYYSTPLRILFKTLSLST